ncbi:MAG TPA: hypothetical protein P5081_12590 [Phycisphaerae bacterium]|nr:hypothetical protein [Phycisphaerae bacterium]HRW53715.1 hypothetical protein [Phycisphaerae bacterium]
MAPVRVAIQAAQRRERILVEASLSNQPRDESLNRRQMVIAGRDADPAFDLARCRVCRILAELGKTGRDAPRANVEGRFRPDVVDDPFYFAPGFVGMLDRGAAIDQALAKVIEQIGEGLRALGLRSLDDVQLRQSVLHRRRERIDPSRELPIRRSPFGPQGDQLLQLRPEFQRRPLVDVSGNPGLALRRDETRIPARAVPLLTVSIFV